MRRTNLEVLTFFEEEIIPRNFVCLVAKKVNPNYKIYLHMMTIKQLFLYSIIIDMKNKYKFWRFTFLCL